MRRMAFWTQLAGVAVLGSTALAGCSGTSDPGTSDASPDGTDFLACLTAAGVEATVNDSGQVLVKLPPHPDSDGGEAVVTGGDDGALAMEIDDAGDMWVVAADSDYFHDDPDTQEAYATCESEHPAFTQPEPDMNDFGYDSAEEAAQEEAALAFAQCARENGYSQVEDPDFSMANALMLPDEMSEAEFRSLLEVCWDREAPIFNFGQSIDATFEAWMILDELVNEPAS